MNPSISITPADFIQLFFGCVNERNAHLDEALHHWERRPGKPAMDMPCKIVPPHVAAEILKADPDGAWIHIQTVVAPHVTYHVMWERRHWLESNERVMQRFHAAREHREAFFTARDATLAAESAHAARMAHMISMLTACGVPKMRSTIFIESAWRDAENEDAFRAKIEAVENLFSITGIYQQPYEEQTEDTEAPDDQATDSQAGPSGETAQPTDGEDRCVGASDTGTEGDCAYDEPRAGAADGGSGCDDGTVAG